MIQSQLKKLNDLEAQLYVQVAAEDLKKYIDMAEEEIRRDMEVAGFRKGKVSKDQLKKYVRPEQILEAGLETALRRSFAEVLEEKNLDIIKIGDLKIEENTAEKFSYNVTLTIYPEFKLPDLAQIQVQRKAVNVEDKELSDTVDTIRATRATFSAKVTPAENGDKVEIDFEVSDQGKIIKGGVSKNHPVVLGKGNFIPGFEDHVVGMSVAQDKEFVLKVPKDFSQKEIAGKDLDVKLKLNSVQAVILPALDDAFAQSLGTNFKNVQGLKQSISDGILQEKNEKESQRVRMNVLDEVIKKSDILAPETLVQQQLDSMIADFDQHLHTQGLELNFYLAHVKKTQDELRKDWQADAQKQVRLNLVLHQIARDFKVEAEADEIEDGVAALVDSFTTRGEIDKMKLDPEQLRDYVMNQVVRQKVFTLIDKMCVRA